MSDFKPAPYCIAPALDDDAQPPRGSGELLTLRRYYCAATVDGKDFPWLHTLTRHYATFAAAESQLDECREEWPNAVVTSAFLAFDPEDEAQLDAYLRLVQDFNREVGEMPA